MKKNIVVPLLALLLLSIFACDEAVNVRFPNENDGTEKIFRIERTVRDYTNPVLYVACKNIKIDYEKNILTIIGLIGLSGDNGSKFSWISENVKIQNENLIIETDDLKFYIIDVIPSPGTK